LAAQTVRFMVPPHFLHLNQLSDFCMGNIFSSMTLHLVHWNSYKGMGVLSFNFLF